MTPTKKRKRKTRISINVCGHLYETYEETLARFPDTLLGTESTRLPYFNSGRGELFFDRNRISFENILFFYQSNGILSAPLDIPFPVFESECKFFRLPESAIRKLRIKEGIICEEDEKVDAALEQDVQPWADKVRDMLNNPEASVAAHIYGLFSLSMTWMSLLTACMETLPHFHHEDMDNKIIRDDFWCVIEFTTNSWFLFEVATRFIISQTKMKFISNSMNLIDFFAVVPYFSLILLNNQKTGVLGILRTLRFVRVVRLFRLSKHSRRLKVVAIILRSSFGNLRLLMLCLVIIIFLGANFMYILEAPKRDTENGFSSIPQSMWWAAQTITTVGYGDIIPQTICGKIFAGGFMLFGAVTISLPVLTIVCQFTTLYPKNVEYEMLTED